MLININEQGSDQRQTTSIIKDHLKCEDNLEYEDNLKYEDSLR